MIKGILFLGIFICSTYLGFSLGESFIKRYTHLRAFEKSLVLMQNQILYVYTPLPEVFEFLTEKVEGIWKEFFKNIYELLTNNFTDDVYGAFKDSINKYKDKLYLKNEDLDLIIDFSKSLGESGTYGQEQIFSLTLSNLKNHIEEARELKEKNCKMYRYLGACLGAVVIIFLI